MTAFLVDASTFITLASIDHHDLLRGLDGPVVVPAAVTAEVTSAPASGHLTTARETDRVEIRSAPDEALDHAADHLGISTDPSDDETHGGDVALLALALSIDDSVVVTDDGPLRKACRALDIPLSGSLGVLVAAVERDELDPETARDAMVAMDEVGARLSARLFRRAERLMAEAAADSDGS